jgi:hypothetical protein
MHNVIALFKLTREDRRALAQAAAERGDPVHEACPHPPGTPEHDQFYSDYIDHRFTLIFERAA